MIDTIADIHKANAPVRQSANNTDKRSDSAWRGYLLLALLIIAGYLWRDRQLISPEAGLGYWLGIVGGSLMLALLLYPVRKRIRILSILGPTRFWFRMHMLFGLVGPLLILYHCNFQLGSLNSQIALYSMLLVAGSGIIGRHFYARIHRGLYGKKTSLQELQAELAQSIDKNSGLANLTPKLISRMNRIAEEMRGCEITQSLGIGRSLRWTFTHHFEQLSLWLTARRELAEASLTSEAVARDRNRLMKTTSRYIRSFTQRVGRVAQFSFYERLFSLWHVLHLPIFILMILSAVFHVLAVHMY